jgi:hypothetical protein
LVYGVILKLLNFHDIFYKIFIFTNRKNHGLRFIENFIKISSFAHSYTKFLYQLDICHRKFCITHCRGFTFWSLGWNLQYPEGQKPGSKISSTDRQKLGHSSLRHFGGLTVPQIRTCKQNPNASKRQIPFHWKA